MSRNLIQKRCEDCKGSGSTDHDNPWSDVCENCIGKGYTYEQKAGLLRDVVATFNDKHPHCIFIRLPGHTDAQFDTRNTSLERISWLLAGEGFRVSNWSKVLERFSNDL